MGPEKQIQLSFSHIMRNMISTIKNRSSPQTLIIDKEEMGEGHGSSKKEAEQEAASQAWKRLKDNYGG